MPIKISKSLPAYRVLTDENIFVMDEARAITQDIRPLRIAIVNLMPTKVITETQLLRLIGNTALQVEVELVRMTSREPKNVSAEHMLLFYKTFAEVREQTFDGMIITGAPVENMAYEEVDYWSELCEIMEWSKTHVHSTFHICWAAFAGLYYHFGIQKQQMDKKLFGVYSHEVERKSSILFRGADDIFMAPHSRYVTVRREDVEACPELKIIASSKKAGVYAISTQNGKQIYITGHSEYDRDTLSREYFRDKDAGLSTAVPENYYPEDDDTRTPVMTWRSHANLLYSNWLNYFVYQTTPYDLQKIGRRAEKED